MLPSFKISRISEKLKAKIRERRLNRMRALSRALNPTTEVPPSNLTYFYGGMSTSYGNAKGIVDQGLPIGVVLPSLSDRVKHLIQEKQPLVFYDTGAYTEFTKGKIITDNMWEGIYANIPTFARPENSFVVLPDKIGDVQETFRRGKINGQIILELAEKGFNLLLPIQAETEFSMPIFRSTKSKSADDFITAYVSAQTKDGYTGYHLNQRVKNKIIPAIPAVLLRDNPQRVQEILDDLSFYGWSRVHLLGAGPKAASKWAKMYPNIHFYCDSVWQRGIARNKPTMSQYTRGRSQALSVDRPTIYKNSETKELDFYRINKIVNHYKGKKETPEDFFRRWLQNVTYRESGRSDSVASVILENYINNNVPRRMADHIYNPAVNYFRKNFTELPREQRFDELFSIWEKFDRTAAVELPGLESIFVTGRRSGVTSQAATQVSTSRTVQNLRSKVRSTLIQWANNLDQRDAEMNHTMSIGAIVSLMEEEIIEQYPILTRDGARNLITFLLWTGYPYLYSGFDTLENMRDDLVYTPETLIASIDVLKSLKPIEVWNDKEYYYREMSANSEGKLRILLKSTSV